jgi:hypothetical protein
MQEADEAARKQSVGAVSVKLSAGTAIAANRI